MTVSHLVIAIFVGKYNKHWSDHRGPGWASVAFVSHSRVHPRGEKSLQLPLMRCGSCSSTCLALEARGDQSPGLCRLKYFHPVFEHAEWR